MNYWRLNVNNSEAPGRPSHKGPPIVNFTSWSSTSFSQRILEKNPLVLWQGDRKRNHLEYTVLLLDACLRKLHPAPLLLGFYWSLPVGAEGEGNTQLQPTLAWLSCLKENTGSLWHRGIHRSTTRLRPNYRT